MLLLAPLAKAASCIEDSLRIETLQDEVALQLDGLTRQDGRDVCEAIRIVNPGGLGDVAEMDVQKVVDVDLMVAMDASKHRDTIAHAQIKVSEQDGEITVRFRDRRWVFPVDDCVLLPVNNTTAEEIARVIAERVKEKTGTQFSDQLTMIEVGVDENHGQWGVCRLPW